jgi:hypothetical protein
MSATTEEIARRAEALSDEEREKVLHYIEDLEEDSLSPRDRFIALMKRLAASIPEEELRKIPSDFAENIDKYAYGDVLATHDKD